MFRKFSLLGAALLVVIGATGCSLTPQYHEGSSLAGNAVYAGGYMSVRDRNEPKGGVGNFTQTVEFGAAYTAAGFIDPALNLSNLAGGMVNLLDMLIDDGPVEARNTIFGWMPASMAVSREQAHEKIVSHVKLSITTALGESKLDYTEIETSEPTLIAYHISSEALGCPASPKPDWYGKHMWNVKWLRPDACIVRASVHRPRFENTPDPRVTNHLEQKSYHLNAAYKKGFNTLQVISPKDSGLKENLLYTKISENLPEWMYVYLAPNTVSLGEGEKKIGFPYVLNQGEAHFFIYP